MPDDALRPRLTVVRGPLQGAQFRLPNGQHVIGRDADADVHLEHVSVSRRHAVIELNAEGTWLTDAGSTNGTWINGQRVVGQRPLCDGDQIRLGEVELRFYDPANSLTDPVGAPIAHVRALAGANGAASAPALPAPTTSVTVLPADPPGPRARRGWALVVTGLLLVIGVIGAYVGLSG